MGETPDPNDALNRRATIAILRHRAKTQRQVTISPDMAEWIADQLERGKPLRQPPKEARDGYAGPAGLSLHGYAAPDAAASPVALRVQWEEKETDLTVRQGQELMFALLALTNGNWSDLTEAEERARSFPATPRLGGSDD